MGTQSGDAFILMQFLLRPKDPLQKQGLALTR
jgi:hypothetical protein